MIALPSADRAPTPPHTPPSPHRGRRRGFSLIEVLVAVVLLAVAAMTVTGYVIKVRTLRTDSSQRSASLVAIQESVDSLRSRGYAGVTTGVQQWTRRVGKHQLTVSSTVTDERNTMKTIDVRVRSSSGKTLQRYITAVYK